VWLDVEAIALMDPTMLKVRINAWARAVQAAGFVAGLYVGEGCPLTSAELYALAVTRYWKSPSTILDRNGQLAQPACSWCVYQLNPLNTQLAGIRVDLDIIQEDDLRRLPSWARAA
jgi:hypothetical protein